MCVPDGGNRGADDDCAATRTGRTGEGRVSEEVLLLGDATTAAGATLALKVELSLPLLRRITGGPVQAPSMTSSTCSTPLTPTASPEQVSAAIGVATARETAPLVHS
jgi:hypothetical protein